MINNTVSKKTFVANTVPVFVILLNYHSFSLLVLKYWTQYNLLSVCIHIPNLHGNFIATLRSPRKDVFLLICIHLVLISMEFGQCEMPLLACKFLLLELSSHNVTACRYRVLHMGWWGWGVWVGWRSPLLK